MSLTFKLLSLAIRTAAKPIGNYIKRQAKEHDGFRRFAVSQAQRVHRIDMRLRLGLLHDPEAQQRMHAREQQKAEEKKRKEETPTVRNAEEQKKHDEQKAKEAKDGADGKKKEEKPQKIKIRPLSEARAIELGANFFSEAFIFAVAAGLLVWDSWRSRKKESARRDDVADRLEQLESEVESLRSKLDPELETLYGLSERSKAVKQAKQGSWWNPLGWGRGSEDTAIMEEERDVGKPAPAEADAPLTPIRRAKALQEQVERQKKASDSPKQESKSERPQVDVSKAEEKAGMRIDEVAATQKGR